MDTIQDFQNVKDKLITLSTSMAELNTLFSNVTVTTEVSSSLQAINADIQTLTNYAQDNIDLLEGEQIVQSFLDELKTLFTKYSAKVEIGGQSGYGESYGGSATGFKFTAQDENGVVGSKTFDKTALTQEDF